jgi:MFS family permease
MRRETKYFLAGFSFEGFADGIFRVIFQFYIISLGFGSADIGTIFMTNMIGSAILTLPMGILSDRYGRVKVLTVGLLFFVSGLIMLPFANTIESFYLVFFLVGVSNAAFVVMGPIYSSFFRGEERDKAFGIRGF